MTDAPAPAPAPAPGTEAPAEGFIDAPAPEAPEPEQASFDFGDGYDGEAPAEGVAEGDDGPIMVSTHTLDAMFPDGVFPETSNAVLRHAEDYGMSEDQLNDIMQIYAQHHQRLEEMQTAAFEQHMNERRQILQETPEMHEGEGWESNVRMINQTLVDYGDEDLARELTESGLGESAAFARFLLKVAEVLPQEPGLFASRPGLANGHDTDHSLAYRLFGATTPG